MDIINEIIDFFKNLTAENWVDFLIALGIIILFKVMSSTFSYMIVKLFNFKTKNSKKVKSSAFYKPLKLFFTFLGIFIALSTLQFNMATMKIFRKCFKIVTILLIAKGFANAFNADSITYDKLMHKLNLEKNDTVLTFSGKIIKVVIYVIAGFIILSDLGYDLGGLATGLGVSSVVIALAAQDVAKSILGGLSILTDKPFVIGDFIQVSDFEGTVEDITFRSTRIRDTNNQVVIIPNSVISDSSIINCSKREKRRIISTLTLEIDTPLEKMSAFSKELQESLANNESIASDTIRVVFSNISDSGVDLLVDFCTTITDYTDFLKFKETINYEIMQRLANYKIELAYPSQAIYLKKD